MKNEIMKSGTECKALTCKTTCTYVVAGYLYKTQLDRLRCYCVTVYTVVDVSHVACDSTVSLDASLSAVFVTGSTSGYLDRRSVTGSRCSLLVRVPSPLTINTTLHSLVGAGVSADRDERGSARCPLELVIEDGSRRHTSPLCPLRQRRQRNVYQSHDSQIRLYFTHRDGRRHQPPRPRHHLRAAFIVKLEGK